MNSNLNAHFIRRAAILLALTFMAIFSLKIILSKCTFFGSQDCFSMSKSSEELRMEISELQKAIYNIEQSVSNLECPVESPLSNETAEKINVPLWTEGNLEVLSGCWVLDWDYKMLEEDTLEVKSIKDWEVCFANGQNIGKQSLSFEDDTKCSNKPITGEFKKRQNKTILVLDDTKDIECTNQVVVYHRKLSCELAQNATHAMCSGSNLQRDGTWSKVAPNIVRLERSKK